MTWDWTSSADQFWRAGVPPWVLLALAGLIGLVLLVTLLRVERTFANGLLAALTLLALAVVLLSQLRTSGAERAAPDRPLGFAMSASVPALACVDDMAGETALTACEKVLFGAPDTIASAVVYASAQLNRLTALGDAAAANREMTPQLSALRRAVERDRYGIFAYVLASRDNCKPEQCAAFVTMTDHNQVAANMNDLIYEGLVSRYAPSWNAPPPAPSSQAALTVGRPTTADFPTAASIPPVNIMSAEPPRPAETLPTAAAPATEIPTAPPEAAKRPAGRQRPPGDPSAAAKAKRPPQPKQPAPASRAAEGPVQLTPNQP